MREQLRAMLFGVSRALAHTERYSTVPVLRRENVAEHSHWVAFYSWAMARMFRARYPDVTQPDLGELLEQAMLHDADESVTGDFLRGVKYRLPGLKDMLDRVAVAGMQEVSEQMGIDLSGAWTRAKGPGFEGAIVKTADFLGVVAYMAEESGLGNQILSLRWQGTRTYLEEWLGRIPDHPGLDPEHQEFLSDVVRCAIEFVSHIGDGSAAQLFGGLARVTAPR